LGIDPQTEKIAVRTQASVTLGSTVGLYLTRQEKRLSANFVSDVRRYLKVHWSPLHEVALTSITRAMVAKRVAEISDANGPYSANRARAALSAFYGWAIGEGLSDANPVVGVNKAIDETSRDRVLSADELRLAWQQSALGEYGAIVRLLILTLQRREEVGGMLWSELDLSRSLWSITADRTKNGLPHDVPLSSEAIAILKRQKKREDRDLVFGAGEGPFQGWSNAKSSLDERMSEALIKETSDKKARIKPWRLHDLRRTGATALGDKLGVLPHVVEAILNHISGHKAGVAGIYNRSIYATEKRAALDAWAKFVTEEI
jgi:integrase